MFKVKRYLWLLIIVIPLISCSASNSSKDTRNPMLYGMTTWGGKFNKGVIFSYDLVAKKDSVLFNFDSAHGERPTGDLIQDWNGNLYGTTLGGGSYGCGVIFRYNILSGKNTVLLNFNKKIGDSPEGNLVLTKDGCLYGVTSSGGSYDYGVLFSFDMKKVKYTVLFNFDSIHGQEPNSLFQASDGNLYGMTNYGGMLIDDSDGYDAGCGVIFSYNLKTKSFSVLFKFNDDDGCYPDGKLIQGTDGLFYGMTHDGGTYDDGVIFSYNISNKRYSVLLNFNDTNGAAPFNNLLQATDGLLYGVAFGGKTDNGIIFRFNPKTCAETILVNFDTTTMPYSALVQDNNGILYGLNNRGGIYDEGYICSYNPANGNYKMVLSLNDTNGKYPNGSLLFVKGKESIY